MHAESNNESQRRRSPNTALAAWKQATSTKSHATKERWIGSP